MMHKLTTKLFFVLSWLAAVAAPLQAQMPAFGDDDAILDRTGNALSQCPPMSRSTVPLDWRMTLVGSQGCMAYIPQGWQVHNDPGAFVALADGSETVGYAWIIANLPGADWTAGSLSRYLLDELRRDTPSLTAIETFTQPVPYGLGQVRTQIVKFERRGVLEVGSVRVMFTGCQPLLGSCLLLGSLSWAPLNQVEHYACIMGQIDATLLCPSGGGEANGCDEYECGDDCRRQGRRGGYCINDTCRCTD